MTSTHRSKTMLALTVYIFTLLIALGFAVFPLWAQSSGGQPPPAASSPSCLRASVPPCLSRSDIQRELDQSGYCWIPPGTHKLDGPIIIRADRTLAGAGKSSVLQLMPGRGDVALEFGESPTTAQPYLYGAYLRDLQFVAGGVRVNKIAQHCGIARVWVSAAPADAFVIDGLGERLTLDACVAWGAARHGFVIRTRTTNNGITLDGCNAQACGGAGVLLETVSPNATLNQTLLDNCTIQGNQCGTGYQPVSLAPADVWIRGYVGATTIRDTWIESPGKLGLRVEPITFMVPVGQVFNLPLTRRVGFLTIEGNTVISECSIAAELVDAHETRLDRLAVHPASAQVRWSLRAPIGAQLMLKADQLVNAAATLPAASQPGAITPVRRP